MARVLILDCDGNRFTVASVQTGRGGPRIESLRHWDEEKPQIVANATAIGQELRQRLGEFGIAPAPLVLGVGRDRLLLKEIKYPQVPAHEEPAIVRFQAMKELTDAGDDIVIDFQPRAEVVGSEKKALVVAVKRDVVKFANALALEAGLKLQAIVPRPFGIVAAVRSASPAPDNEAATAALSIGPDGGEFNVSRGEQLLFSRPVAGPALADDTALLGEMRRNLAVYNSQSPQWPVRALYVAEGAASSAITTRLSETLAVPVHSLSPLAGLSNESYPAGSVVAAAGLARLANAGAIWPINFVKPREPKPPVDPHRRPILLALGSAAAIMLGFGLVAYWQISTREGRVTLLMNQRNELDGKLATLEPDKRRTKALDDWLASDVVWLDEIYDLTARFPELSKLRLIQLNANPVAASAKSKYVGRVTLKGLVTDDVAPLNKMMNDLANEGSYKVGPKKVERNTLAMERQRFSQQFETSFEVEQRPPLKYTRHFDAEAPQRRSRRGGGDIGNLLNLIGGAP